ncbi:type I-C CRISPR-associated protein Cas7/Csd2 [Chlorobaculum sp. 24CR]|uniref:type I-C CRISPR-associated protein Cas7/Csd2 n=1 Tax=Chlorobaculum sp. 24CR TaxID=2508878 RepID=UPI00100AA1A0|nr:type I-C CRISPR-associated protein Cas7/Csd2 [Chlorobaculum sp. 24CR]RXK87899.1 type I-C CRISPR-associated protein Cas7/Csd2 [Chlorobaculum sp. 24CR]
MKIVNKRYDFVLLFDVKDGNPNGDPDAGNLPRIDAETGIGMVTDVCLKRKVRNFISLVKGGERPYDIYVKEKGVLGRAHFQAFNELGINIGESSRKDISEKALLENLGDVELPEGVRFEMNDEKGQLVIEADADKNEIKGWLKENKGLVEKGVITVIEQALKDSKPRKPTPDETAKGRDKMCQNYYDIRTFGAVMALKSAPNCGQVRGPVQLTFARSVDPVVTLEHSITRMAVATEAEAEKQGGENRTMGRKYTIPYALYRAHGFISAHLAFKTGFTEDDLSLFWEALLYMFEHDRSAARGLMSTRGLYVFEHGSALGNAPAHKLFERIKIMRQSDSEGPVRSFEDYVVQVDENGLDGVKLHKRLE